MAFFFYLLKCILEPVLFRFDVNEGIGTATQLVFQSLKGWRFESRPQLLIHNFPRGQNCKRGGRKKKKILQSGKAACDPFNFGTSVVPLTAAHQPVWEPRRRHPAAVNQHYQPRRWINPHCDWLWLQFDLTGLSSAGFNNGGLMGCDCATLQSGDHN